MKKFAGTYLMVAIALALGGYTYWEFQHAVDGIDPAKGERLAFTFAREKIDHVELAAKGESATLEKVGEHWKVTKPLEDLADDSAVESFLFSLVAQRVRTFRGADEGDIKWADYGLQPGRSSLELGQKGQREKLEVATKNAYDGSFYVRQKEEVLLGDKGLAQITDRSANSFRSRKVWREDDAKITHVIIERPEFKEKFAFTKNGKTWNLEPAPAYPVDMAKFETWMNKIQDLQPGEIVKEGIEDADKSANLLTIPSEVVRVALEGHEWALTIGQDKSNDVFIYANTRPTLYKTSKAYADPIRVTPEYFRDGKVPFKFDVEAVRTVVIRDRKFRRSFKKEGTDWKLVDAAKNETFNADQLVQLISRVKALDALEFVKGGAGFAAEPTLELRDGAGKVVASLTIGDEYKAKQAWNSGQALRYLKAGGEVVGILKTTADHLLDDKMIAKTAAKTTAPGTPGAPKPDAGKAGAENSESAKKLGHPEPNYEDDTGDEE